jgi:hypothetical protein
MARDPDHLAAAFETENTGGLLSGFLAEEEDFDRRAMWRLGSWGAAAVGVVIVAVLANQSSIGLRREQVASVDFSRQAQQIQSMAKDSQSETRRLAAAIDTLNGDRDRLYSRVTVLEQGLDSVTGAIARQGSAVASQTVAAPAAAAGPQWAAQNPAPAPVPARVATTSTVPAEKPATVATTVEQAPASVASVAAETPAAPGATLATLLMASKSLMAPPDSAATKLTEPGARPDAVTSAPMPEVVAAADSGDDPAADASPKVAVQRTEFGVDIGGANSPAGLRALWRGYRSNKTLATLRPIIVVRENDGGVGMQLRLVAGPLDDAAAAAKICAALMENRRSCETTVFEGQRLSLKADEHPSPARRATRRRSSAKRAAIEEPVKKPEISTLSALFGTH